MTTYATTGKAFLPGEIDGTEPLDDDARQNAAELSVYDLTMLEWDGTGQMIDGGDPESARHDNTRRAGFALHALEEYADLTGGLSSEPVESRFADLLGDLMHLADALGVNFDDLAERGRFHYEPETRGEL